MEHLVGGQNTCCCTLGEADYVEIVDIDSSAGRTLIERPTELGLERVLLEQLFACLRLLHAAVAVRQEQVAC